MRRSAFTSDFATKLRALRDKHGMSLDQASGLTGGLIKPSSWHEYERGDFEPKLAIVLAICLAFRVSLNYFVPSQVAAAMKANQVRKPIDICKMFKPKD